MKIKVLIDKGVVYTRTAVIKEDALMEFYLDANQTEDIQNKVIQGQISKVVKNLKAAFVDFGEEKNGLLPFNQIPPAYGKSEGTRLPVQILREQHGDKGHKLTGYITITGKYLVCLPFEKEIVISKKIKEESEREALKTVVETASGGRYGFVVRTNAIEADKEALKSDVKALVAVADEFMATKGNLAKGSLYFEEMPLYMQVLQDLPHTEEPVEVITNEPLFIEKIESYKGTYRLTDHITCILMDKKQNLFATYDIEKQIDNLFKKRIWLKNGGNIIIEPTEAMTVIDVNSAKAVLSKNHRKSVLELNKLAVVEAANQIILRNLSGMAILDLVDMREKEDKEALYEFAKQYFGKYDKRSKVYPPTALGLLQIARTKKYASLYDKVYTECTTCNSKYGEPTFQYVSFLLEQKIRFTFSHTVNHVLYVKCQKLFYHYLQQNNLITAFENSYDIKLQLSEESTLERQFFASYHE